MRQTLGHNRCYFRLFEWRDANKILGAKLGANGHSLLATPGDAEPHSCR
jgi:hypothetical protein